MTSPRHTALRVAAIATLGAGVIHAAVVEDHASTWWVSGVFFALLAAAQLGWGLLALVKPQVLETDRLTGRALLAGALLVNGGSAVLWAATRWITGEPFGPNAGMELPIGPAGIASTLLEVLAVGALLTGPRLHARPTRGLLPALVAAGLVLAAPTAWGVAGSMAHDHASHSDGAHGEDGHHDDGGHDDGGHDDAGHDDGGHQDDAPEDGATGDGAHRDRKGDKQRPSSGSTKSDSPAPQKSQDDHGGDGHAH